MLNSEIIKKIEDFVYLKPRSIQEISEFIGKNWRTADRYISEIMEQFGTISTRTFRDGTRGALKIVYWSSIEKISNSVFQEVLEQEIMQGREKQDFSAFDIFQHVANKDKKVEIRKTEDDEKRLEELFSLLLNSKKQVLFFSGNLSFINLKNKNQSFFNIMEQLVKKGVKIKVICRIDLAGKENAEKLLSLNFKYKKELIEIRSRKQPVRAAIIDNELIDIKEIIEPTGKTHELNKKMFIFYRIRDKEWIEWLSRIFFKMFNQSIDSRKRIEELDKIRMNG